MQHQHGGINWRISIRRCQSTFCICVNQSWFCGALMWILPHAPPCNDPGARHNSYYSSHARPKLSPTPGLGQRSIRQVSPQETPQSGFADLFSTTPPGPGSHWMPCQQKKNCATARGAGPDWAVRHQTSNYLFSEPNICMELWSWGL